MLLGIEFPGKPPGIEDQVVAFGCAAFELDLRAAVHPGDVEHFRVDMFCTSAFVQQIPHQVGG